VAGVYVVEVERTILALRRKGVLLVAATGVAMKDLLDRVARQERVLLSLGWHPFGTPTGSIPPAPPWRVSGLMSRQVKTFGPFLIGIIRPSWQGKVGPDVVYGRIHELGGWTGAGHRTYLPPRPSLGPAWRIVRPTVRPRFEHELKKAIRF
jgi:hypothetical protein